VGPIEERAKQKSSELDVVGRVARVRNKGTKEQQTYKVWSRVDYQVVSIH